MKRLAVRLPDALIAQIEAEARERKISKSAVVRERLERPSVPRNVPASFVAIRDLIGAVKGLPPDLSARKKHYLNVTGFGRKARR